MGEREGRGNKRREHFLWYLIVMGEGLTSHNKWNRINYPNIENQNNHLERNHDRKEPLMKLLITCFVSLNRPGLSCTV